MEYESPIEEIYAVRQKISAKYNHNSQKYFRAIVEEQKKRAKQGQVYWGFNASGELVPLPLEAISNTKD